MNTSLERIWLEGDRIMLGVAWALFALSLALASWYGTWGLALTAGLGLALSSTAAAVLAPGRRGTRLLNAAVFMSFSALLIQQAHGMIEMHFSIFVLLAFLLFYRDWLALVTGALVIAVHHFGFHLLQHQGVAVYVFPMLCGVGMVFVHAAFVVFETALLVYMAVSSQKEALDAEVGATLGSRISADGKIDLRVQRGAAVGVSAQRMEEFLLTIGKAVSGTRSVAAEVHAASGTLDHITGQIRLSAEETAAKADVASTEAGEVLRNVGVVAAGSEGMLVSMRELAANANEAARFAKQASDVAETTNIAVSQLGESTRQIGMVAKVIATIAQQTNLLALNATIEAARVGEAGKGFSVVANEVKELANQTARATDEIRQKIEAIQKDSKGAVTAIQEIGALIMQVRDVSSRIAAGVEQQSATTGDIGRTVHAAASGATGIAANIADLAKSAQDTNSGASDTQKASNSLAEAASRLEALVGRFEL